ncbi:hypothetical protein QW180_20030 [Vibrio sinaloensis]|nr:hypothetical protein [Vibrio sinaloensis]
MFTELSADRFIISLLALCLLCNTSSYYYDKAVTYIQSLYREGIEDLAYLDQLTGLANRWSFESWASEKKLEQERNSNTLTAMVFFSISMIFKKRLTTHMAMMLEIESYSISLED